jgi:hypothetical protein
LLLVGGLAPEVPPPPFFAGCLAGGGLVVFFLGGHLWNMRHVDNVAMDTWVLSWQTTMPSMCE